MQRPQPDAGFGLIEAIVALMIITLGLAAFSQITRTAFRAQARVKQHDAAQMSARSHLDRLGLDAALADGVTTGTYADDLSWKLAITTLSPPAGVKTTAPRSYWVVLEVFDRGGVSLMKLETAKLARDGEQP